MTTVQRTHAFDIIYPDRAPARPRQQAGTRSDRLLYGPRFTAIATLVSVSRNLLLLTWALAAIAFWIVLLAAFAVG